MTVFRERLFQHKYVFIVEYPTGQVHEFVTNYEISQSESRQYADILTQAGLKVLSRRAVDVKIEEEK